MPSLMPLCQISLCQISLCRFPAALGMAVLGLAVFGLAAPALADEKAANCAAQAAIVDSAVSSRLFGAEAAAAVETIQANPDAGVQKFAAAAPMLVEWVYTLSQDQLTPEVAATYKQTCLDN